MPAFMKLGDIKGEATDADHKDWILIDSLDSPIDRTIPVGAKDQQRTKGETVLGEAVVKRQVDKSSTKLQEACANGTFYKEVEIHFCTTVKNKQEPYSIHKLSDVIVSSYAPNFEFDPKAKSKVGSDRKADGPDRVDGTLPTEIVGLSFTKIEWTYVTVHPGTGDLKGKVIGKYNPAEGRS